MAARESIQSISGRFPTRSIDFSLPALVSDFEDWKDYRDEISTTADRCYVRFACSEELADHSGGRHRSDAGTIPQGETGSYDFECLHNGLVIPFSSSPVYQGS
ncbi:uncharacterized protein PgNI_04373 [Pyricularia grisea]|uniref:Uncharacterized protein n=1 Tax=Pyricularia grisea TaxID=148305 RepID=A0A6P8B926_PYRGI|nr:uncharacterized protein PgNI_04373 [Pyricularia grisea]TLD12345.1 hypothetical protein PgNI_04373 [Pyricularia grisea]